ncbi:hypothetical protein [Streptomyces sp. PTD5-9]|uniref:hypothetical protein n=1 Tax=Streptomyces sp. PTD5-9 TaxID=3120150 RepID=UPI00300BEF91
MRFELRTTDDGDLTLCAEGRSARELLDDDAALVRVFDADSWEHAMAQYHAHQGWGPYRPA